MKIEKRSYKQSRRAESALETHSAIMAALVGLWYEKSIAAITLADVADRAGVTVQTVIRRFKSKDGLVDATIESFSSGIEARRDPADAPDLPAAIHQLAMHYEADGEAVLRTLTVLDKSAAAQRIAQHGAAFHRTWCATILARELGRQPKELDDAYLDSFVAATDIQLWRLFRKEMGLSAKATEARILLLAKALVQTAPSKARNA